MGERSQGRKPGSYATHRDPPKGRRHGAESGTPAMACEPAETYSRFDETASQRTAASTARCASSNPPVAMHFVYAMEVSPRTAHSTSTRRVIMAVLPAL